ncbi:hypothetical protein M501DRAFT_1033910 [Patellaria atrata CBS 101060]|uniref:Uncharacterized protein n=1 Tax=Patellaria atrata CBS 101060 TaxID=1346257 RepID=A0A9P4S596_9PEZI|nr:hypothetical protein M501DRAFT_1033910 [Patellaria atrata CBS 101060]
MDAQRISSSWTTITQISQMLSSSPDSWHSYIASARVAINSIDATGFMTNPSLLDQQIFFINTLQRLAYVDADSGGVIDLANWCLQKWLAILSLHPQSVAVLRGIAQYWLYRAQPCLARIHAEEGESSSSSSGGSVRATTTALSHSTEDEYQQDVQSYATAQRILHSADHVEARGLLLPATEYFRQAVALAEAQDQVSGDLLVLAAEAHMSLGNVSYSGVNIENYEIALDYLRSAMAIPGYVLEPHLHQYLDDYGQV